LRLYTKKGVLCTCIVGTDSKAGNMREKKKSRPPHFRTIKKRVQGGGERKTGKGTLKLALSYTHGGP